ncbi:adenylate/guanylate cyclase domain-containing protein [Glutamicibacter arilaitensis]|jgi:adenylate cyclase|uniref:Adenylate/guanylate cyclase domain-containing protein n=1 Tax=Glutamicibacter arilaitensis TaxID=256701 RepID=A0A2N7S6I0_9MICC|nr:MULTISPECIES: adenylate/guanylate cyclase domain-containing protein [Glutamicibacter]PMQ21727.1 adenylate/guanylate cyclase domain-containing protein [Glutamicibacter arilaitensis]TFH54987.1 adenylate/guanylate cyclase domain-containing protein [Glutamicibacter arilaitensis]HCJ55365.1 adenylate/guanylate cyclase domain-containing protein [Glutamicibacter sp.]HCM94139.1 adenylate/guanylate cyclase domain-containing protein [Glutamicibacter sp.]
MSTEHTNTPRADSPQSAAEAVRGARQHPPVATPAESDPILELAQAMEGPLRIPAHTPDAVRDTVASLERRLIGGQREFRRREVASEAGVSLHSARKLWRAIGFPELSDDEVFFTQADKEALGTMVGMVREGKLTEETAISLMRSVGQMTDRMVVWQIEALVEDMIANQNMSDRQARRQLFSLLPEIIPAIEDLLLYSWRRQLNSAVHRMALRVETGVAAYQQDSGESDGGTPLPLARAVGFADLVSYTSLSRRMNERTLAQLVQRFEAKCAEIISVGGGRLVKTIGDEVLYVAETPQAGAQIALSLSRELAKDELFPQTRGAVVWGRLLSRLGDIYGPTVNMAARLTSLAEPGSVLTDAITANTLRNDARFVLTAQEITAVRGFGDIQPYELSAGEGEGLVID